jgi:glucokinase
MMILAGDIGGTNTRLALCRQGGQGLSLFAEERYPSAEFSGLDEIIKGFLSGRPERVERACFGVPGPVDGDVIKLPNLPWTINRQELRSLLAIEQIGLINDLEANAYGLSELGESDFAVLNKGKHHPTGNAAIISAGTGLGEAGMHFEPSTKKLRPFASEGGHADFAPRNELEIELLRFLLGKFKRVSVERVLSGNGLRNIYEFLRDTDRAEEPAWLADEIAANGDPAAVISANAIKGRSPICEMSLEIFVSIYGAEAGNLALKMLATGGIFIGGGIAPKILPSLQQPTFMDSFLAKGRMSGLLERIPVKVILDDKAALLGAAHFAINEM